MLLTVVYRKACLQRLSWSSRVIENINTISSLMNHLSRTGAITIILTPPLPSLQIYRKSQVKRNALYSTERGMQHPLDPHKTHLQLL